MVFLYIYNPTDNFDEALPKSAMRPEIYLEQRPLWRPALEETFLIFDFPESSLMFDINPFGLLKPLIAQLSHALQRLKGAQRAIIASAYDGPPTYITLEPDGEITYLSVLLNMPLFDCSVLNTLHNGGRPSDQVEPLYHFVDRYRSSLRDSSTASRAERRIQSIPLSTERLLKGLEEESDAGRSLLSILGIGAT